MISLTLRIASVCEMVTVVPITVTIHDAETSEPSIALTDMVAVPAPIAVILPDWSTIATCGLSLVHIKRDKVVLLGTIVALIDSDIFLSKVKDVLLKDIDEATVSILLIIENSPHTSSIKYLA